MLNQPFQTTLTRISPDDTQNILTTPTTPRASLRYQKAISNNMNEDNDLLFTTNKLDEA